MVDPHVKSDRVEAIRLATILGDLAICSRHDFHDVERRAIHDATAFLARLVDRPDLVPALAPEGSASLAQGNSQSSNSGRSSGPGS